MRRREGFVLIAALWFVVALSTVGLEMSLRSRARRLATANALEGAKALAMADAGIEHARACLTELLRGDGEYDRRTAERLVDPWHYAGACLPDAVRLNDASYALEVHDANGLLHLNVADPQQLRAFLRALRVDWGEADRLAQAIVDWRDPDDLRHARGAETGDYLEAGALVLPRNAPFASVREPRHVRGMTPDLFERVAPFLTVLGTGKVNVNSAPEPVLLSMPGMTPAAAAAVRARVRAGRPIRRVQELADALPLVARQSFLASSSEFLRVATFETRVLRVVSTAVDSSLAFQCGWSDNFACRCAISCHGHAHAEVRASAPVDGIGGSSLLPQCGLRPWPCRGMPLAAMRRAEPLPRVRVRLVTLSHRVIREPARSFAALAA